MGLTELEALEGNAKAVLPNSCSAQIENNESQRNESGALSSLTAVDCFLIFQTFRSFMNFFVYGKYNTDWTIRANIT